MLKQDVQLLVTSILNVVEPVVWISLNLCQIKKDENFKVHFKEKALLKALFW